MRRELATTTAHNVLTFDVEDWYQLTGRQLRGHGEARPDILARQLDRVIELLARHGSRATFNCLGCSLASQSHLVRRIADAGHEVASHGWAHEPIHRIGLTAFREDLRRSLGWLQDLLGHPVAGYRAPAFSVPPDRLEEFYDVCFAAGLSYDSSVFPISGRRYGIPNGPLRPAIVREDGQRRLVELPLATVKWLGRRWPVAGGGYWRLLPGWMIRAAVARVNREGRAMVTYLHPYEFDPCRLGASAAAGRSASVLFRGFKQNLRRGSMYGKLDTLLAHYRFGAAEDYLRDAGYL
jgi:polysaccharide deacetylase family protein (PEP-CTERM system associated)